MADANAIIDIPRLRTAIGGVGDSSDTLLTAYRSSAIAWISKWTGRQLLDVTGWRSEPEHFVPIDRPDIIAWRASDIAAGDIVIHYSNSDAAPMGQPSQTMTIPTTDSRVNLNRDAVFIYSAVDAPSWPQVMRFSHPIPYIVCDRGMSAASVPAPFGEAVALIVRALYEGSSMDDLSNMSVLDLILGPWKINAPYAASAE